MKRVFLASGVFVTSWALMASVLAAGVDDDLDDVRQRIDSLERAIQGTRGERTAAERERASAERAVSTAQRDLRATVADRKRIETELAEQQAARKLIDARVKTGQQALSAWLRQNYMRGGSEVAPFFVARDANQLARDLHYLERIGRARLAGIEQLRSDLREQARAVEAVAARQKELKAVETRQQQQMAQLKKVLDERSRTVATLSARLGAQEREVEALRQDEEELGRLIAELARQQAARERAEQAEAARKAEEARLAEAARKAEEARRVEAARVAAVEREAARRMERERLAAAQAERARQEAAARAATAAQAAAARAPEPARPAPAPAEVVSVPDETPVATVVADGGTPVPATVREARPQPVTRTATASQPPAPVVTEAPVRTATVVRKPAAEPPPAPKPEPVSAAARTPDPPPARTSTQLAAARLAPAPTPSVAFSQLRGRLNMPVAGSLTGRFGAPRGEGSTRWRGIFIRAGGGADVRAVAGGRVVFADWMRGYGNIIIVDHGAEYMTVYGNNDALLANVGDRVAGGAVIAAVGASGSGAESGLYFEIRHRGQPVDPMKWVRAR